MYHRLPLALVSRSTPMAPDTAEGHVALRPGGHPGIWAPLAGRTCTPAL
jgi:hypothetical protein